LAIAALVMAGGKATRMQAAIEKPLLKVRDQPIIHHVINALKNAESVNRLIVAVTPATRHTAKTVRDLGVEVFETAGKGYEQDMKQAIKTLGLEDVVIVAADLPFLAPAIVDGAVQKYFLSGKPALMVAAPIELYERFGLKASYAFNYEGQELVPVGLNVIDGTRIDEGRLDETVFVVRHHDLIFNVNTQADLKLARNYQRR
jgi:adenosylcobinamide-phosphate guanylyltransferase